MNVGYECYETTYFLMYVSYETALMLFLFVHVLDDGIVLRMKQMT